MLYSKYVYKMADDKIKQGSYVLAKKFLEFGNTKKALEYFEKAEISKQEWVGLWHHNIEANPEFALECFKHTGFDVNKVYEVLCILEQKYRLHAKHAPENRELYAEKHKRIVAIMEKIGLEAKLKWHWILLRQKKTWKQNFPAVKVFWLKKTCMPASAKASLAAEARTAPQVQI